MEKVIRTLVRNGETVTVELDTVSIAINGEERFRLDNDMTMASIDGNIAFCGVECCEVEGGNFSPTVYIYTHGRSLCPMGVLEDGFITYKLQLDNDTDNNVILTKLTRWYATTRCYRYN